MKILFIFILLFSIDSFACEDEYSSIYKDIFLSNYQLISGIKALVKSYDMFGQQDEFIAASVKQKYSVMRKAVAEFNKQL